MVTEVKIREESVVTEVKRREKVVVTEVKIREECVVSRVKRTRPTFLSVPAPQFICSKSPWIVS